MRQQVVNSGGRLSREGELLDLGVAPVDLVRAALHVRSWVSSSRNSTSPKALNCEGSIWEASSMACRVVRQRCVGHRRNQGLPDCPRARPLHDADHTSVAEALPRQPEHERIELLAFERLWRPASAAWPMKWP